MTPEAKCKSISRFLINVITDYSVFTRMASFGLDFRLAIAVLGHP